MKSSGVYVITCAATGEQYIGSAVNLRQRWTTHRHGLNKNRSPSKKLQAAWNKYGEHQFSFSPILLCSPENTLLYEQLAIDALAPLLNTRKIAASNVGLSWGLETRASKPNSYGAHTVRGVTDTVSRLAAYCGVASKNLALATRKTRCAMATSAAAVANSENSVSVE